MTRTALSRPVRLAIEDDLIGDGRTFFDYGCGRGQDFRRLQQMGIEAEGWDPNFRPGAELMRADVVNLGYVVNVIEDSAERAKALTSAWQLAEGLLIVAGRLRNEFDPDGLTPFADGWLTGRETFQKFYEQAELRHWIDVTLGVESVASGPGVFYVFKDVTLKQSFLAQRARRRRVGVPRTRISDELFLQHQDLLQPLLWFFTERGRLPKEDELENASAIHDELGSIKKAFRVVLWATDEDEWAQITTRRREDLLIYLGLTHFEGRPRLNQLPRDIQNDVKAFFGAYNRACAEADALLFSAGNMDNLREAAAIAAVGKITPSAVYVHTSALPDLPPLLRVYEGCASTFIGSVDNANVIKLSLKEPRVSYLNYPRFDTDPHPALQSSVVVPLQTFWVRYRDYSASENPPILHRKELLVSYDHPRRPKFERLTKQEETWGLFDTGEPIGTRRAWNEVLDRRGAHLRGHRLVRRH